MICLISFLVLYCKTEGFIPALASNSSSCGVVVFATGNLHQQVDKLFSDKESK